MIKKVDYWTCPNCGEDDCECWDEDCDYDLVVKRMLCHTCEHEWREYFCLTYDGYTDDTGEYDADGTKCEY